MHAVGEADGGHTNKHLGNRFKLFTDKFTDGRTPEMRKHPRDKAERQAGRDNQTLIGIDAKCGSSRLTDSPSNQSVANTQPIVSQSLWLAIRKTVLISNSILIGGNND